MNVYTPLVFIIFCDLSFYVREIRLGKIIVKCNYWLSKCLINEIQQISFTFIEKDTVWLFLIITKKYRWMKSVYKTRNIFFI